MKYENMEIHESEFQGTAIIAFTSAIGTNQMTWGKRLVNDIMKYALMTIIGSAIILF